MCYKYFVDISNPKKNLKIDVNKEIIGSHSGIQK
jgi:hypothetical protein